RFEGGVRVALGSSQADQVGLGAGRGERQKEVAVDGQLCVFLMEEVERRLPHRFERAAGSRQLESDARSAEIDLHNVYVFGSRRSSGARDQSAACERMVGTSCALR